MTRGVLRLAYGLAGALALGLGVLGAILPVLPTTPFVLLAAFCFAKSFPAVERWLYQSKAFGPMLVRWKTHRVVPLRVKLVAWGSMALSFVGMVVVGTPWWGLAAAAAVMSVGSWYLATKPSTVPT